jgi:hypothetical protein
MTPKTDFQHARVLGKTDRILAHLQTATQQLDGQGGTIEDMSAAVRTAYELTKDLRDFLTPVDPQ